MTTLKERAAKAMLVNDEYDLERLDHYEFNPYAEYLSNAEAALAAIAEPSEAMINAMMKDQYRNDWNNNRNVNVPYLRTRMAAVWRAAHAAMMAEKDIGE